MDVSEKTRLKESQSKKMPYAMTPLEKCLIVSLVMAMATVLALIISIASYNARNNGGMPHLTRKTEGVLKRGTCESTPCVSEAARILKSMDLAVDPCVDFYSYACGNWIKDALLVRTIDTEFLRISKSVNMRVKDILLKNDIRRSDHEKKVKDFYDACLNLGETSEKAAKTLKEDIKYFGGWPLIDTRWKAENFSWSELMVKFYKNGYIDNMILSVGIERNFQKTSSMILVINQPTLGLKSKVFFTLPDEDITDDYTNIIYKIAEFLNPKLNKTIAMKDIKEALNIETRLANLTTKVNIRNIQEHYNIMTLQEMQKIAPKIPWRELLQQLLPYDVKLEEDEKILVLVPSFINGLNKMLEEMDNAEGMKSLANYMFYRALMFMAPHLSKDFFEALSNLRKKEMAISISLSDFCAETAINYFHFSLTKTYSTEYEKEEAKELLKDMFRDIQSVLIEEIKEASWLDNRTKAYALVKARTIRTTIAYPEEVMNNTILNDYYRELNISDNHYLNMKNIVAFKLEDQRHGLHQERKRFRWSETRNLLKANAFYQPNRNRITIPVGLLQEAIFSPDIPNYIIYGRLGAIIGHEITHAFDTTGSLYDADGNYRKWWTNTSWTEFRNKTQCFVDQYGKYYEPRAQAYLDGQLTLEENIADNGGVQVAYKAYNKLLSRIELENTLPGLHGTEKEMFWTAFASMWCRKQTDDYLAASIKQSSHTPAKFRVLGSLSNMKEFAEDFKCESGLQMNPETKCLLWD